MCGFNCSRQLAAARLPFLANVIFDWRVVFVVWGGGSSRYDYVALLSSIMSRTVDMCMCVLLMLTIAVHIIRCFYVCFSIDLFHMSYLMMVVLKLWLFIHNDLLAFACAIYCVIRLIQHHPCSPAVYWTHAVLACRKRDTKILFNHHIQLMPNMFHFWYAHRSHKAWLWPALCLDYLCQSQN